MSALARRYSATLASTVRNSATEAALLVATVMELLVDRVPRRRMEA